MGFLRKLLGLERPAPQQQPTLSIIELPGNGKFQLDVVGESFYQGNLQRICGPRKQDGENRILPAYLVLDDGNPHDNQAVRVEINRLIVGHLSREDARAYRERLAADGHSRVVGQAQARIMCPTIPGLTWASHAFALTQLPHGEFSS